VARALAVRVLVVLAGALGWAGPALGQTPSTRVTTQSDLAVSCSEPGCDCVVNGVPDPICPATWLREYDSGDQPASTSDSDLASASGTFVGYDSTTTSDMELQVDAAFGTLQALARAHTDSAGAYVDAGGLASGATAEGWAQIFFSDAITVTAPVPGGSVAVSFTSSVSSAHTASVGGGGLAIDPCLANGHARTQVDATLAVTTFTGTGGGLAQYGHTTHSCNAPVTIGAPTGTVTATATDGNVITFSQSLLVDAYARADGGEGGVAHPNRARSADALVDASSTAKLYVEVLTPGATYTSASGTVYEVPEPRGGGVAALAALLATGVRRRRSSRARSRRREA
jgi:MYXO-CTERM domain-containing protein